MRQRGSLNLSAREIECAFAVGNWAAMYPPILTVDQAAAMLAVPKATIYDWSSRKLLADCAVRVGKHLRIFRDRFIKHIFSGGLNGPR